MLPKNLYVCLSVSYSKQSKPGLAYRLGTGEVRGSNPCKGDNFSVKISNGLFKFEYEYEKLPTEELYHEEM